MQTENNAVDAEKREEITTTTEAPPPMDEGAVIEPGIDEKSAGPSSTAVPETAHGTETSGVPEAEGEAKSGESAAAAVEASQGNEFEPSEPRQQKQRRNERGKQQRKKERKPKPDPALTQVVSWFAACGRCSFFLAGYTVAGGEGALETAVAQRGKKWLHLTWNRDVANLVHKSYGSRVDINCYHYEGRCQECRRRFVYHAEDESGAPSFRIELRP